MRAASLKMTRENKELWMTEEKELGIAEKGLPDTAKKFLILY